MELRFGQSLPNNYFIFIIFFRIKEKTGLSLATVDEARASDPVRKAIQAGVEKANKRATSRAQVVQKFEILPTDFSIPGGELGKPNWFFLVRFRERIVSFLGPTLKLKRASAAKKYAEVIENFYKDDSE